MPSKRAPVILLPPSEGKAPGGGATPWGAARHTFRELDADRAAVRDAVRRVVRDPGASSKLLGVRGAHLERALQDWKNLDVAPTLPTARRYTGVVWTALDIDTLDATGRRRTTARVLVPSGMWGLLAAGDAIPSYRLKMGARLPGIGALAAFWRPRITPLIDRRAAGGWVIDLLPHEHAAAIDPAALGRSRRLRIELLERDSAKSVGHAGKSLKGQLARAIIEADARDPVAVAAVVVPGLAAEAVTTVPGGATLVFRHTGPKA